MPEAKDTNDIDVELTFEDLEALMSLRDKRQGTKVKISYGRAERIADGIKFTMDDVDVIAEFELSNYARDYP